MEQKVMVWGKPYTVSLYQKSKSVWTATGDYNGERITVTSRSPGSATKLWRDAARYRGNIGPCQAGSPSHEEGTAYLPLRGKHGRPPRSLA